MYWRFVATQDGWRLGAVGSKSRGSRDGSHMDAGVGNPAVCERIDVVW